MPHDQLFKTLLRKFFADFVRIVMPDLAKRLRLERARFLDKELHTDILQGRQRRLDLVAEVDAVSGEPELVLVHVEIEARTRRTMGNRMWRYAMQLWLRHHKPVVPIVLVLRGGHPDVRTVTLEHQLAGFRLASFTYFSFGLSRSRAAFYLDRPEALAPALAALMARDGTSRAEHKLACLRRIARAEVDEAGRFLLVNTVETYVELDDAGRREYARLLAREPTQEVRAMEMTWADRLEARGREEGRQEGRLDGMRSLLLNLIEHRFEAVPPQTRGRINSITSPDELARLADRVLDARSVEDLGF
ncbi:MAG: Rpn family recombination-promoting nuclease/putative transposase [Thermoanaerobaculia bacterium]